MSPESFWEVAMRRKRRAEKGSFGGELDELVKLFPHEPRRESDVADRKRVDDAGDVHDRLFARAWRQVGKGASSP